MNTRQISPEARAAAETDLLKFLCDANTSPDKRLKLAQQLSDYLWSMPDNALLFECIRAFLPLDSGRVLPHLPAALIRRGFPDLSLDFLCGPAKLNAPAAFELAGNLLHAKKR